MTGALFGDNPGQAPRAPEVVSAPKRSTDGFAVGLARHRLSLN
jgi:hypothetical protein